MLNTTLQALSRHRKFCARLGAATQQPDQYEVFSVGAGEHLYRRVASMKQATTAAAEWAQQYCGTVVSIWSPVRAHVQQVRVQNDTLEILHGPKQQEST